MSTTVAVLIAFAAAAFAVFLWVRLPQLTAGRRGRWLLLVALFAMPLLLVPIGLAASLHGSKERKFCTSCHEMRVYETSLAIDDPEYLPAVHVQNHLVPAETACYTCHTDYTMYGDVEAKLNGMKHVWVHTFGDVPADGAIELYKPYPNDNCLQCHRGSRRFEKKGAHNRDGVTIEALYANEKSCVGKGCHDKIHDIDHLGEKDFYGTPTWPVPDALKRAAPTAAPAEDPFADEPAAPAPDAAPATPKEDAR